MNEIIYKFPDYNLLKREDVKNNIDIIYKKEEIEEFFENFNVCVECKDIFFNVNSVTYVVKLIPGTKLSRIKSFKQDLIMRFNAIDIEFEIPVNGTGCLGIVIIKEREKPLMFGNLIDCLKAKKEKYKVPIILGKDFNGDICIEDLAQLPHLLIAGTTGTGKSTFLSTLIVSILYSFNPDELKLILVDTRATNFLRFNRIPHLLIPVITESVKTEGVLIFLINEMKNRYKLFEIKKVDNIDEYNKITESKIPRIVLMIEDLYDLMLYTDKKIEKYIKILTQMSRAAGIHVIISTQRTSINVITGIIKSNIPARISFYVPSYMDSRTIIDEKGAEKLQSNGDIIFRKIGGYKDKRIQTPYITDKEIAKVIEQVSVNFNENDCKKIPKMPGDDIIMNEEERDPLLCEAIQYIIKEREVSTSMIQRRFKVSYVRAGKIIDQMESEGIISGYNGSKPRIVLLRKDNKNDIAEDNKEENNTQVINDIETDDIDKLHENDNIFDKWWFWLLTIIFILTVIGNI